MVNKYILILVWIGFMGLIQGGFYREEYNEISGEYNWRVKPLFAFIAFAPIIWMAANRGWIGDSYNYWQSYCGMPTSIGELRSYLALNNKGEGFTILSSLIKMIVGENSFRYFLLLAIIQGSVVIAVCQKWSKNYIFTLFLFIASTEYISWMFNGVRQFTAAIIVFAGTSWMMKKNKLPLILLILLAATVHQTVLVMIPLAFVIDSEAWNKKTVLMIVGTIIVIVFISRFTGLLNTALEYTQYAGYLTMDDLAADDGANPLRALVYTVPALISFVYKNRIKEINDPMVNLCTNCSIITACIYWISVFTSGVLIARLTGYISLYSYILLPWELDNCVSESARGVIKSVTVILYIGFYYYQVVLGWGLS